MAKATKGAAGQSTMKPLMSLGFTQAQLSRMFQVDTCTTSVWVRANRLGERCVGRVRFIPELKGRVTPEQLRPDLDESRMRVAGLIAKEWDKAERDVNRPKETPGERKPGTGVHDSPRGGVQVAVRKRAAAKRKRAARGDAVVADAVAAVGAADAAVAAAPRRKRATKRSADAAGVGVAADAAPRRKRPSRARKQDVVADAGVADAGAAADADVGSDDSTMPLPGMDQQRGDDDTVTFA